MNLKRLDAVHELLEVPIIRSKKMNVNDKPNMADMEGHINRSSRNKEVLPDKSESPLKVGRESAVAAGSDNVSLSAKARELQEAREALDAAPEVRKEKVEEIKGRVEAGTYNVKAEAIADAIIKASLLDKTV